jgi:hypothetical protein
MDFVDIVFSSLVLDIDDEKYEGVRLINRQLGMSDNFADDIMEESSLGGIWLDNLSTRLDTSGFPLKISNALASMYTEFGMKQCRGDVLNRGGERRGKDREDLGKVFLFMKSCCLLEFDVSCEING